MKYLLQILLFSSVVQLAAQQKIIFKSEYRPETDYEQVMDQNTKSEMTYVGSQEFLDNLKKKNIENPTIKSTASRIESHISTGKKDKNSEFPFLLSFGNLEGDNAILKDAVIYGKVPFGEMAVMDSITSPTMENDLKRLMLKTMQSMFSQLSIPQKTVTVGETFTIETPLSMPIADVALEMTIVTHYKLLKVEKDLADFEIKQVFTMKSTITKYEITAEGTGDGAMVYDIKNHFNIDYKLNTRMSLDLKMEEFTLLSKTKSTMVQKTSMVKK